MGFEAWLTLGVIGATIVALVMEWGPIDALILGAVVVLMAAGVLDPVDALGGFGSIAVLTVGALLVVAAGMRRTGLLNVVADRLFGHGQTKEPLLRMMIPASFLSAFMNNTPIVAMFAPAVIDWCKRNNRAPSRMLMPLSFATMLGGMCTLIGTSATLVVDGLMRERGMDGLGMFEIAWAGVPITVLCIFLIWLLAPRILPDRRDPVEGLDAEKREYLVEMLVDPDSPLVERTIADVGLRNLGGLFLMNVERGGKFLGPVKPSQTLQANDRLVFAGMASTVVELRRFPGLSPAPEAHYDPTAVERRDRMFEVVISPRSPLVSKTIKDIGFRSRYDAAVIAVHRAGHRLDEKIGEVELRAGDTLMIEANRNFEQAWGDSVDFGLISRVRSEPAPATRKAPIALTILALLVGAVSLDLAPMVVAAFVAVGVMVISRVLTTRGARRAVDLRILVVIAGAIGLGRALEASGAATVLADLILLASETVGGRGLLAVVFVVTVLLASVVNNVAAVAIIFPIVTAAAAQGGFDPRPFLIAVALAGSSSFATPMGTQPNLIIYGPGGYRFTDFLRLGLVLQVAVWVAAVTVIPFVWPLASEQ